MPQDTQYMERILYKLSATLDFLYPFLLGDPPINKPEEKATCKNVAGRAKQITSSLGEEERKKKEKTMDADKLSTRSDTYCLFCMIQETEPKIILFYEIQMLEYPLQK